MDAARVPGKLGRRDYEQPDFIRLVVFVALIANLSIAGQIPQQYRIVIPVRLELSLLELLVSCSNSSSLPQNAN